MTHAIRSLPSRAFATISLIAIAAVHAPPAQAGIALSKVIVDLSADAPPRDDIEITNTGEERAYIVAEPAIIQAPGTAREKRVESSDPTVTGLLVTPQKLVLEPRESKLVRVALVAPRDTTERVFRLTIKPVAGAIQAEQTALKVFVGYDVLVIARPSRTTGEITATRAGGTIAFHNGSNASVEMSDGQQCDAAGKDCTNLPAMRLYAGADWSVPIHRDTPVTFRIQQGGSSIRKAF